ncbi:hypothetical protein ACIQOV_37085 [Kitasatospora sp. NPDC091257]|uniref:hypothetical protein n=1 Tax=Kitasatospora sp. NPDC091257 TaxID=3364084 RepID=UPI003806B013
MPKHSAPLNTSRTRHAAVRDENRLDALFAGLWTALHLPVIVLLAFAAHHQTSVDAQPPAAAVAPDRSTS